MGLVTLRGSGPAPAGYHACWKGPKCPAWRHPSTGRFGSKHFHPVEREEEAKPTFAEGEEPDEDPPNSDMIRAKGWERFQVNGGVR